MNLLNVKMMQFLVILECLLIKIVHLPFCKRWHENVHIASYYKAEKNYKHHLTFLGTANTAGMPNMKVFNLIVYIPLASLIYQTWSA